MTEPANTAANPAANGQTAGAMLRAARQQQGLALSALATQVKVPLAKLEALEADRYDELPDTAFTRALAKTLCRVLKSDPAPVLARLPGAPFTGLDRVSSGLNTPFRDRPDHTDPAGWVPWRRPVPWAVAFLLACAAAFVLVPIKPDGAGPDPGNAATTPVMPPAAEASAPALGTVVPAEPAPAASAALAEPAPGAASAAVSIGTVGVNAVGNGMAGNASGGPANPVTTSTTEATAAATPLNNGSDGADKAVLRAVQDTWVQATDGSGQVLTARLIPAGETVELTGKLPIKLRIGNANGTELSFRGLPLDVKSTTRDNVANITLQ